MQIGKESVQCQASLCKRGVAAEFQGSEALGLQKRIRDKNKEQGKGPRQGDENEAGQEGWTNG